MAFKDSDFTFIASVRCALKGVRFASRERNFRIDIVCAVYHDHPRFRLSDLRLRMVGGGRLFRARCSAARRSIQRWNTSSILQAPDYHVLAGKAKDCAAGAVLLFAAASFVIGCIIFIPKSLALVFGA